MVHNMDNTKPYPDVMEMLEELKNRKIAVVSSGFMQLPGSMPPFLRRPGRCGDRRAGEYQEKAKTRNAVNEALRQLHTDRRKGRYIGDSDVDVMTAKNSGICLVSGAVGIQRSRFSAGTWGFILVSSPLREYYKKGRKK